MLYTLSEEIKEFKSLDMASKRSRQEQFKLEDDMFLTWGDWHMRYQSNTQFYGNGHKF